MENETYIKRLKDRLQIEFKKQDRSGVYGYTQRSMAYNSNRIEGSTLTEKQTASMFETGTLYVDDPDMIFRTKDIEEMNGHFKMFNYVMKCMEKPLSEDIIKNMHKNLKEGVFEDRANGYAIGGWRKRANRVSDIQTALPQEVPEKIHQLLEKYHNAEKITLYDIAKFHAQFENIHPFQDGNGRTGRLILNYMLEKEGYPPIALKHDAKQDYKKSLEEWQVRGNPKMFLDVVKNYVLDELQERIRIITVTRETMKVLNMDLKYENSEKPMELDDDLEI